MSNQHFQDREAISSLLIDYCIALDRREFSRLVTDVFAPDASFGGSLDRFPDRPAAGETDEMGMGINQEHDDCG